MDDLARPSIAPSWAVLALCVLLTGCAGEPDSKRRTLTVFAASSLTDAFEQLEREFELANPEVDVRATFSGSQVLRLQIEQGARADLFASANADHLSALHDVGLSDSGEAFASNELVLIVPLSNPAGLHGFADLPRAERIVVGSPNVPIGIYTRALLEHADLRLEPQFSDRVLARVVSEESNVRLTRAKVELGEADAAIVYRTDAIGSKKVRALPIPEAIGVRANYYVASILGSEQPELARRWIAHLHSPDGRAILSQHGFAVDSQP